jgi:hypothetical protein
MTIEGAAGWLVSMWFGDMCTRMCPSHFQFPQSGDGHPPQPRLNRQESRNKTGVENPPIITMGLESNYYRTTASVHSPSCLGTSQTGPH